MFTLSLHDHFFWGDHPYEHLEPLPSWMMDQFWKNVVKRPWETSTLQTCWLNEDLEVQGYIYIYDPWGSFPYSVAREETWVGMKQQNIYIYIFGQNNTCNFCMIDSCTGWAPQIWLSWFINHEIPPSNEFVVSTIFSHFSFRPLNAHHLTGAPYPGEHRVQ